MPRQIKKRDGRLETWSVDRIAQAIFKALKANGIKDSLLAKRLAKKVENKLMDMEIPEQEYVQDMVELVLMESRLYQVAKKYILYREKRREIRSQKQAFLDIKDTIDSYMNKSDWRVNENANMAHSFQGLMLHLSGSVQARYALEKYPEEIRLAHEHGYFHIHDLSFGLAGYCAGWSLRDLLLEGFNLEGRCSSGPAKHFDSALGQMVNFLGTLQNEWAGAQAFNNVDTYLAPFVRYDGLDYHQVKQAMQKFVFNLNTTSRWGGQCVDAKTLCLTPTGWKKYSELQIGDKIYVFDLKTKKIKEDIIKAINVYDYNDEIFFFKNRKLSFLVTPNHKIVRKQFNEDDYVIEDAITISKYKTPFEIPLTGEIDRADFDKFTDDEIRLMAWLLSDSHLEKKKNRINIYQSTKKYANRIRHLLNNLNIQFKEHKEHGQWGGEVVVFRIYGDSALKWRIYTECNRNKIPEEFVRNASARQFKIFIEEYILADGCCEKNGRKRIAKKNENMANDILHICTLAGIAARRVYRDKETSVITIYKKNHASITKVKKIHYKGKVWCPTTETGTFIAKRKGHVFITGNSPFTNLTFDLVPPKHIAKEAVIIGGKLQNETYGEFAPEMEMINKAFLEVMLEGDYHGRIFSFPIPTYNVTPDFPWESEVGELLLKLTAKYGVPYFQNFINSDLKPEDVRSMCCRLQMDLRELRKRTGGLFGAGDLTGSIGVVTLNLPKLAFLAQNEGEFFDLLTEYATLAKDSLEFKRKMINDNLEKGMFPFTKRYLKVGLKNHFSTIGLVGGHEACVNLLGKGIETEAGMRLMERVLEHLRSLTVKFQEETGNLYNLEATPAEGTSYRLAKIDKALYNTIYTSGDETPYYTNSTALPVGVTRDVFFALEHQNKLQPLYTGGTVFHTFLGEAVTDTGALKSFIIKALSKTRLPYLSITPTFSVCKEHGYLQGEHFICPKCGLDTEVYTRVVGYYRPVSLWNKGKQAEYKDRQVFELNSFK